MTMTTDNPLKDALAFIPERIDTVIWPTSEAHMSTLAQPHRERIATLRATYEQEVREAAEQGYRHTHCIHGTRMVFSDDRDAICGWCEEGLSDEEQAIAMAHDDWHSYCKRVQLFIAVSMLSKAMHADLPTEAITVDWTLEPLGVNGPQF